MLSRGFRQVNVLWFSHIFGKLFSSNLTPPSHKFLIHVFFPVCSLFSNSTNWYLAMLNIFKVCMYIPTRLALTISKCLSQLAETECVTPLKPESNHGYDTEPLTSKPYVQKIISQHPSYSPISFSIFQVGVFHGDPHQNSLFNPCVHYPSHV